MENLWLRKVPVRAKPSDSRIIGGVYVVRVFFPGIWKRTSPIHEAVARMMIAEAMMRKLTIARGRTQSRRDFRFRRIPSSFSRSDVV